MYRSQTRQRVALAALVTASVTLITLDFRQSSAGPIRRAEDAAMFLVTPLQKGIARVVGGVSDLVDGFAGIGGLRGQNARLHREVKDLRSQQLQLPELKRENERLLALLDERPWTAGKTALARIIGSGPSNQERTAFLDKGKADGLEEGMVVVSSEGLLGRLVHVTAGSSKVLFLADPQHSVGARLTGSGETGVVTGRGGGQPRFELIDPSTTVRKGEEVVTSGHGGGVYPPGIPIGRVTSIRSSRDGLTLTALLQPFVDFSRLDFALVLLETEALRQPSN